MNNAHTTFAVLPWHPDPRYHASEAVAFRKSEKLAQRYADKLNASPAVIATERGYVVRPVEVA